LSGEFLIEGLSNLRGILYILVGMDEGGFNGHGGSAKALVIGIMPVVDMGLVSDLVILLFFGRLISDNDICTYHVPMVWRWPVMRGAHC